VTTADFHVPELCCVAQGNGQTLEGWKGLQCEASEARGVPKIRRKSGNRVTGFDVKLLEQSKGPHGQWKGDQRVAVVNVKLLESCELGECDRKAVHVEAAKQGKLLQLRTSGEVVREGMGIEVEAELT